MSRRNAYLLILATFVMLVVEIVLLREIARNASVTAMLIMLGLTGAIGLTLLQWQGAAVLRRAHRGWQDQRMPKGVGFQAVCILLAGILLLLPGLISDAFAALLLLPSLQRFLYKQLASGPYLEQRAVGDPARRADRMGTGRRRS